MKRLLILLTAVMTLFMANAATSVTSAKIYINPGHGSWGPNDRPMATIPYPMLSSTGRPDTCGFYESNTNLWKGLRLREALIDLGVKATNIKMSRVKNGPYPYNANGSDRYKYNRNLSEICEEVDTWGADMFFSIHSDAATEGGTANRSLYIFRGKDANNYVAGSKAMAQALWTYAYVGTNGIDYASSTSTNIRGDIDFYGSSSTRYGTKGNYTGYLGVLKHGIPGFLAEGYCHTYQPARHRALNKDYCGQEGVRYSRGIASYFGWTADTKGYIMGFVKDKSKSVSNSLYTYKSGTRAGDEYWPVMGAHVYLYKDGEKVASYLTDNNYNGVFVFDRLTPGTYTIIVKASGYQDYTQNVTVTANNTTYPGIYLTKGEGTDPDDDPDVPDTPTAKVKGVYAYNLNLTKGENNSFTFTFNANSEAASGRIIFTDSISGNTVGSYALTSVSEGLNTVTVSNSDLPEAAGEAQVLNWSVELTGTPITGIARLDDASDIYSYTRACPISDNNPESDYFGRFYVSAYTATGSADNGLYAYNADWSRINSSPYKGGETFRNNMRPAIDGKGTVYFTDWGDPHSGIYITHPADNFSTFTQFFMGTRESSGLWTNNGENVGSSIISASVAGMGNDTRLYAFLEDFSQRDVAVYNIGNSDGTLSTSWDKAPSAIIKTSNLSGGKIYQDNSALYADDKGGLWVCTYRSQGNNNSTAPSIIYVDKNGSIVYDSGSLTDLNGSYQAAFAVNRDNTRLAVNDASGYVQLFDISWNGNTPSLSYSGKSFRADVVNSSNYLHMMTFDYADNLIVGGAGIAIYSMPQDNIHVTPAKLALTLTKGEVIEPQPEPYVIKKDIDTYAATDDVTFESNWVRSVKDEYDNNITFEEDGIKNRGFAVSGDKVLIAGRSENTQNADLFLTVLNRATGETVGTIQLGSEAQVELYGCNDVLLDKAGHIVISNLTIDVSSVPLQLFQVDTVSGNVTRVASLVKANVGTARIDHCAIYGDVTTGNFIVMAAQAGGKNIITWWLENGEVTKSHVIEAAAFYPATATGFGIAPRIYAVDDSHAVITGSSVHPTVYDITTGAVDDSFANNTDIQPDGLYANGFAAFYPATATGFGIAPRVNIVDDSHAWVSGQTTYPTLYDMTSGQIADTFADNEDIRPAGVNANGAATPFMLNGRHLLLYPSEDYQSSLGNKWSLAVSDKSGMVADLSRAFEFPTRGIGAVHSQTWGAPAVVLPTGDKTADIYVYAPGAGLASYTLTSTYEVPQPALEGDVNLDGAVNAGDVSAVYNVMLGIENDEGIISRADVNGDGSVNAGDVSAIYNIMLK